MRENVQLLSAAFLSFTALGVKIHRKQSLSSEIQTN